jgi:hypothetical protein
LAFARQIAFWILLLVAVGLTSVVIGSALLFIAVIAILRFRRRTVVINSDRTRTAPFRLFLSSACVTNKWMSLQCD